VVVDAAAVRNPAVAAAPAGIAAIAATDSIALPAFVGKNNAASGGLYRHAFRDLCCCPGRGRYSDLHTPRFALPGYSEAWHQQPEDGRPSHPVASKAPPSGLWPGRNQLKNNRPLERNLHEQSATRGRGLLVFYDRFLCQERLVRDTLPHSLGPWP